MEGIGFNSLIRSLFPALFIDVFDIVLFTALFGIIFLKGLPLYLTWKANKGIREKWSVTPKDVVIFHTTPRGNSIPNISPFAMKLETFLRMAKIKYQHDGEFPFGPKAKTPWITFNGQHIGDSQLIIDFLKKKFDVKLGNYNDKERAIGRAARIMVDEHLYWGGLIWRFFYCDPAVLKKIYRETFQKYNWLLRKILWWAIVRKFREMAWAQGSGRHSYKEVVSMMSDTMADLSVILGEKKFILGDEPCEDDAAIFGLLSEGLYASPGAPFHDIFKKHPNLVHYTNRMRDIYWPDWNQLLAKGQDN